MVAMVSSAAPRPWTPSTTSSTSGCFAFNAVAISRIGRRMPLLECTQVNPTTRVAGFTADNRRSMIPPVVASTAASNNAILRIDAPERVVASRIDSWCE